MDIGAVTRARQEDEQLSMYSDFAESREKDAGIENGVIVACRPSSVLVADVKMVAVTLALGARVDVGPGVGVDVARDVLDGRDSISSTTELINAASLLAALLL